MQSDNILLRTLIVAGLTTKASELTAEELDQNFVYIWEDLKARSIAGNVPAYSGVKTYTLGETATYGDATWVYVNAVDDSGIIPGSDPDYWETINVEALAHNQNTDEALGFGSADYVTAAEIRAFIDAGGAGGNFFEADLLATGNRVHDADGFGVTVNNLSHWWQDASDFAPTSGRASHEFIGYGTAGGDVIFREVNGAGLAIRESYGDKSQVMFGKISIHSALGLPFLFEIDGIGAGSRGLYAQSSGLVAIKGMDASNVGVNGQTDYGIGVYGEATNTSVGYGGQFKGKFSLLNIPTSSAGLSTGDVWNDSGTLKIV